MFGIISSSCVCPQFASPIYSINFISIIRCHQIIRLPSDAVAQKLNEEGTHSLIY